MIERPTDTGFSIIEALLILVVASILGFTGWYVYHVKQATNKNYSTANSSTVPTYKQKTSTNTTTADPYAGWRTYTSTVEKVTFKYPSDWTVDTADQYSSNDPTNKDYIALKSPDGKVIVHWTSLIDGFGNEHGKSYPKHTVVSKTPIPGAKGDYVVSGITTLDGSTYYPWIAVENNPTYGVMSSGVSGLLDLFMGRNNINSTTGKPGTALFSTSGPETNQKVPGMTQARAKAYLANADMQQAKLILMSLTY